MVDDFEDQVVVALLKFHVVALDQFSVQDSTDKVIGLQDDRDGLRDWRSDRGPDKCATVVVLTNVGLDVDSAGLKAF